MYKAGQNTKAQFPRKTWRPDMASSSHFSTVIYIYIYISRFKIHRTENDPSIWIRYL